MKLPKTIPEALQEKLVFANRENEFKTGEPLYMYEIYQIIIDYLTLEHDFWVSVDTPPEKYSRVWIKNKVTKIEAFFTNGGFEIDDGWHKGFFSDYPPTHWQYFEIPSMLTIAEQSRRNDIYLKEQGK